MRRVGGKSSLFKTTLRALALAMVIVLIGSFAALASVTTDQTSYAPGSVVHITGDGMNPGATVYVSVLRPDGVTDSGQTIANDDGTFSYDYTLPGPDHPVMGTYYVTATDGTNTFTTSFTDGVVTAAPLSGPFTSNTCGTTLSPVVPGETVYVNSGAITVQGGGTASYAVQWVEPDGTTVAQIDKHDPVSDGDHFCDGYTLPSDAPVGNWTVYTCAPAPPPLTPCDVNPPHGTFLDSLTFTVAETPTLTTTPEDASNNPITAVDQGTTVHDHIVVTTSTNAIPDGSTVSLTLYTGPFGHLGCTSGTPTTVTVGDPTKTTNSWTWDSNGVSGLTAGDYAFQASFTSGNPALVSNQTGSCEPFTVKAPETPTVSTEIHLHGDSTTDHTGGSVDLGSVIFDTATVGTSTHNIPSGSSVTFKFYSLAGCTGTYTTESKDLTGGSKSESVDSSETSALHAGSYSYKVSFVSGNTDLVANADATCENVTVNKADTTTTTSIGSFVFAGPVHDTATVSSTNTSGFLFNGTNNLVYKLYSNLTCTGTPIATDTVNYGSNSLDHTLTPGSYCFTAQYLGNSDYNASTVSAIEPFTVVPPSLVTNSSLCPFDTDPSTSTMQQFNLIYTPDISAPTYKLNASNPGQFYYNVFYVGSGNTTVNVSIPAGFVTQGAVPIHVYSSVAFGAGGCLLPGTEIANSKQMVSVATGGTLNVSIPSVGGFAYVAIHLDYYYKGITDGCTKDNSTPPNATNCTVTTPTGTTTTTITNNTAYAFSWNLGGPAVGTSTIYNINVFKKDPGIGGLVTQGENPLAGKTVNIYDGSGHPLGTVTTDQDGWYMWAYKYTGKAATFVVKLPAYNQSRQVTLKSNGYLEVDFIM